MEVAVATVLILGTIIGAAALAIAVPFAFGLMIYDVAQSKKAVPEPQIAADTTVKIAVKRGVARGFVILGGAFWSLATFADSYSLKNGAAGDAALASLIALGACLATLVIGWYWERFTAALLMLAAFGVVAWGVIYQFEPQVWAVMALTLIGPMATASVLFWLARRDQEAYERATALRPKLAFAFAARSTIGG